MTVTSQGFIETLRLIEEQRQSGQSGQGNDQKVQRQLRWFTQVLDSHILCERASKVREYIDGNFAVNEHERAENYLLAAIRRGDCGADTKPQLQTWCIRQLKRFEESQLPFRLAEKAKAANGRLTLSAVKHIASFCGTVRAGTPPFPQVVHAGDVALIHLENGILRVPGKIGSDDPRENFVPVLRMLWPFAIHEGRVEKYVSRESRGTGELLPHRIPLHQLFLELWYDNTSNAPIRAKNGNFLDWTNGNLQRRGTEGTLPESRFRQLKRSRDGADILPLKAHDTADPLDGSPVSAIPARPVRPKGHGPDADDFGIYSRNENIA